MAEVNIDQDFLMKFSCMGTQDKDVLISELHRLLDAQLSREGCEFFLDMTNWNLQAAVGAFYDYYSNEGVSLPKMTLSKKLQGHHLGGAAVTLPPNSAFTETWILTNAGPMPWPAGVHWTLKTGGELCSVHDVPLPLLPPGGATTVAIEFRCPPTPGLYHCHWRACTSGGALFGDPAWVIVRVEVVEEEEGMNGLVHQLSSISTQEGEMEMESATEETRLHPHAMATTNPFLIPPLSVFDTASMMSTIHPAPPSTIATNSCLERSQTPPSLPQASTLTHTSPMLGNTVNIGSDHSSSILAHADSTSNNSSVTVQNTAALELDSNTCPPSGLVLPHPSSGHIMEEGPNSN